MTHNIEPGEDAQELFGLAVTRATELEAALLAERFKVASLERRVKELSKMVSDLQAASETVA
jgi:hypothetical protein